MNETTIADSIYWTEYGIPIRNLWHMLLYSWNEVPTTRIENLEDVENAPTLDALLAFMLVKLTQQRLRIGLGRDYIPENHPIDGIRGRINFSKSLKYHAFEHGQTYCDFQQYSIDTPKNQIIRSTLMRLVQLGDFGSDRIFANELRHKLRLLTRMLAGVKPIELKLDYIRRQQTGRNDRDYKLMLAICELILQRQMPTDTVGKYGLPSLDRASLILHRVYERFVANFYQLHLRGWTIRTQKQLGWHEKSPNKYLPMMRPDLILEDNSSGRIVILDTKFTAQSLVKNQYAGEVFNSSHLYQLYAYLKTQELISERYRDASGILLYPAVRQPSLYEKIELQDKILQVKCLDLTANWQAIEQSLLDLILVEM